MLNIKKLISVCSVRRFKSQAIIFEEGDPGSEMFIILTGSVRALINAPNGSKIQVASLKPGDTFGEMSLLEGLKRSATVQAIEETTTVAVNETNFESVIREEPSLALRIMKSLSERIRKQNTELANYKERLSPNPSSSDSQPFPSDTGPQSTSVEVSDKFTVDNIQDSENIGKLIQHFGKYNVLTPTDHSTYLFDKQLTCPVCGETITVKNIRTSKLRLKQVEPDYRQVYTDFDPLWYNVWVCTHCYYANFSTDFSEIRDRDLKRIKELSHRVQDTFGAYPDGPVSLIQVLTGYYLMLYWFQQLKPDLEKLGKLWLRLSWLYQDIQEEELSIAATKKALEYFENLLKDLTVKTTAAQDQYLYLLVAELTLKMGNIAEARNFFRHSITLKGGNERMKEQAQNRIQELKSKL